MFFQVQTAPKLGFGVAARQTSLGDITTLLQSPSRLGGLRLSLPTHWRLSSRHIQRLLGASTLCPGSNC